MEVAKQSLEGEEVWDAEDSCARLDSMLTARGAGADGSQGALPAGAAAAAGLCGVAVRACGAAPWQQPGGAPGAPARTALNRMV